jgi:hypothetical protein
MKHRLRKTKLILFALAFGIVASCIVSTICALVGEHVDIGTIAELPMRVRSFGSQRQVFRIPRGEQSWPALVETYSCGWPLPCLESDVFCTDTVAPNGLFWRPQNGLIRRIPGIPTNAGTSVADTTYRPLSTKMKSVFTPTSSYFSVSHVQGGLILNGRSNAVSFCKVIPYKPKLSALILNAIFYGSIYMVSLQFIRLCVMRHRIRNGKCPECAHIRHSSSGCPECGWQM